MLPQPSITYGSAGRGMAQPRHVRPPASVGRRASRAATLLPVFELHRSLVALPLVSVLSGYISLYHTLTSIVIALSDFQYLQMYLYTSFCSFSSQFLRVLYHLNRFAMSRSQTSLWWAKSGQVTGHRGPPGEKISVTGRLRRHVPPRKPLKNE